MVEIDCQCPNHQFYIRPRNLACEQRATAQGHMTRVERKQSWNPVRSCGYMISSGGDGRWITGQKLFSYNDHAIRDV